jgi:ABC-2 type transport system ATP-binding protein
MLEMRDVAFAWKKGVGVLKGLSISVERGEHLALLGPNGSGKSTALSLCAGLYRPDAGSIKWTFDGAQLAPDDPRTRARYGVVFQHPALDKQLSGRDNLILAGHIAGMARPQINARVTELLASAGLTARAEDRVKDYSGGMRRRLDLARVLMSGPSALLLDEPTVGLDAEAFDRFWQQLATLRRATDLTLIVATHRPEEAARCDRLVMIDQGRAVHDGTPEATVRALGQDMLALRAERPEEIANLVTTQLGLVARVTGPGETTCEVPLGEDGARLLVRLVELFPSGRLQAIELRRPTLGDAFLKLTGSQLADDVSVEAA